MKKPNTQFGQIKNKQSQALSGIEAFPKQVFLFQTLPLNPNLTGIILFIFLYIFFLKILFIILLF